VIGSTPVVFVQQVAAVFQFQYIYATVRRIEPIQMCVFKSIQAEPELRRHIFLLSGDKSGHLELLTLPAAAAASLIGVAVKTLVIPPESPRFQSTGLMDRPAGGFSPGSLLIRHPLPEFRPTHRLCEACAE
jgi:hypothetical protein